MFEKAQPVFYAHNARFAGPQPAAAAVVATNQAEPAPKPAPATSGDGEERLRIIDWNELTARLNAARDLRRVLKREARGGANGEPEGFADAAARYFLSKDKGSEANVQKGKRGVNPVALEQSKGSSAIDTKHDELLAKKARKPKQATTGLTPIDPQVTSPAHSGDAREY